MLPDWDTASVLPTSGSGSAKAALAVSISPLRTLTTPRLLGPTTRVPEPAIIDRRVAVSAWPSGPLSVKPSARIVTTDTPSSTHSARMPGTCAVGAITKACSGTSGRARSDGQARSPCTSGRLRLTG